MTYELKVGDMIKDNDPRMVGRVLRITELLPHGVRATRGGGFPDVGIRRRSIFTDDKPRRTGFSVIRHE